MTAVEKTVVTHKLATHNFIWTHGAELRKEIADLKALNARLKLQVENLQESRAKYEAIVGAFDGFIYICSANYEVEFMNERLVQRTGRNAVGEKCHEAMHDLDAACPWCVNERVFRGETVRWEVLSPKDNRWYSVVNTPLRHGDGSLSKMAVVQDITERKLSEERTRQQNEFISHVLESLTHPFYVIDANSYRVLMANSAAQWEPSAEKTTCFALTHGRTEPCNTVRHPCPIEEVKRTKTPVTVEHVHYDRDGNPRNMEVHAYPIFDVEGNVVQILEYGLDITERKRVEAEREKLIRQLETSNEDLKMFGCAVSHDLRSPLITLRGFLSVVERDAVSGNVKRLKTSLRVMDTTAAKMEHLIDELKELSLIGRVENQLQNLSLSEVALEAFQLVAGRIAESGAQVKIAPNLPTLYGDRSRLLQVFQNLIENAIKFRDAEKPLEIEIGVRSDAGEPVLYFKDNGIGIDPNDHDRIFGLFNRLAGDVEGTGFGLALVKRIIEAHEGRIWLESHGKGHGSTFCLTLPGMAASRE
ncbi:MAG: ATP-binding protein [Desulfomonilaceae bacterium]